MADQRPGTPPAGARRGATGATVGGRYRLARPLVPDLPGAEPWAATDTILDRPVRVDLISGPRTGAALDAARRAALVTEPRLTRILQVAQDGDLGIVVTEQVEGRTLAELAGAGPIAPDQVRAIVGEVAAALEEARRRGLHHLALRPGAVVITPAGRVSVRGLAVDGALIGHADTRAHAASRRDAIDLIRLLYAGLTGRWPAPPTTTGALPTFAEWSHSGAPGDEPADPDPGLPAAADNTPPGDLVPGTPADLDTLCSVTLGPHEDGPHSPGEVVRELEPWRPVHPQELYRAADAGRWPTVTTGAAGGAAGSVGGAGRRAESWLPAGAGGAGAAGGAPVAGAAVAGAAMGSAAVAGAAAASSVAGGAAAAGSGAGAVVPSGAGAEADVAKAGAAGAVSRARASAAGAADTAGPSPATSAPARPSAVGRTIATPDTATSTPGDDDPTPEQPAPWIATGAGHSADAPAPEAPPVAWAPLRPATDGAEPSTPAADQSTTGTSAAANPGSRPDGATRAEAPATPTQNRTGGSEAEADDPADGSSPVAPPRATAAASTPERPTPVPQSSASAASAPDTTTPGSGTSAPAEPGNAAPATAQPTPAPDAPRTATPSEPPTRPGSPTSDGPTASASTPPTGISAMTDQKKPTPSEGADAGGAATPARQSVRQSFVSGDGAGARRPGTPPPAIPPRTSTRPAAGTAAGATTPSPPATPAPQQAPPATAPRQSSGATPPSSPAPATAAAPAGGSGGGSGTPDWGLPFDPESQRPARAPRTQFDPTRWVLGLVGVGLVVVLVIAIGNVTRPWGAGRDDTAGTAVTAQPTAAPSEDASAPPAEEEQPAAPVVAPVIAGITTIDPSDDNGEKEELIGRINDGDPNTAWYTHTYNRPDFAGFKDAVGIAITLAEPATVNEVILEVNGSGGNVEVRATDAANPTAGDILASGPLNGHTVLTLSQPTETQNIVLWFTALAQTPDGKNRIEISELSVG
ncbi:hypothetical protein [Cellulomonas denverensis]|uniref:Protein kinase domain-containing protein n=1 Tax=Cellulomonas denverensis TaxID=264297 RepID=A0A7X6KY93_9CELL|nr:hypothetical protein [Cellulomonas denverensis]NKY24417.1 hypothetical protein [Cellulomonas denverensis]GIG26605.1 hypothetical protein Cde04nite_28490 [Cellulomonas denverensis]